MPSTIIFIEKFYEIDEFSTFARPCGNQRELLHNCKLQLLLIAFTQEDLFIPVIFF